jgi:hypothetical protein
MSIQEGKSGVHPANPFPNFFGAILITIADNIKPSIDEHINLIIKKLKNDMAIR